MQLKGFFSSFFTGKAQEKTNFKPKFLTFSDFKTRFSNDGYFKLRTIAITTASLIGLFGIFLCLSLVNATFGIKVFHVFPGSFFSRSYGILAFFIPVFLIYAASILVSPQWRPERIFILCVAIFPFFTLAIGFSFIRDFDLRSQQFAFLDFAGKTGFNFVIVLFTVVQVLVLRTLKNLLFSGEKTQAAGTSHSSVNKRTGTENQVILLPPPAYQTQEKDELLEEIPFIGDSVTDNANLYQKSINLHTAHSGDESDPLIKKQKEHLTEQQEEDSALTRAIEEAEAAAAIHSEQARKKTSGSLSKETSYKNRAKKYKIPIDILNEYPDGEYWIIDQATKDAAIALKETLEEFRIQAEVTGIKKGPVITMFEILPAPGVKLARIVGLQDNIALRLAASSVRIVAPIPGKHAVGIEVPNAKRNIVSFKEIIEAQLSQTEKKAEIPVVMGKDLAGEAQTIDLVQMPHLLIAGATGSGKSVCVNAMILSILYQLHPSECKLILIDPKIVELKLYNDIPHLLTPVITEPKKAFQALQYCIYEMERRYACLDSMGVRDIRNYNKRIKEKNIAQEHMPYIVIIIDEFADLMATTGKELESTVARLAAMSRAVGIHLVLATQRPSIDVITGLIKANIPSRIAFMVSSKMDSRIIIDMVGADKLLGKGDMLYAGVVDPFPIRMQGAFISEEEIEAVVEHVKTFGEPDYIDEDIFFEDEEESSPSLFTDGDDPLYERALEIVLHQGKASASYIQRRLSIGFNRAARLIDEMENNGVVGPAQGSKPREVLRGVNL